jgi:hypothetical protein
MASATLTNLGKRFPAATSVGVYPVAQKRIGAAPGSSALSSATVTADHKLTFVGLTPGAKYTAYASVSSEHRYVDFEADKITNVSGLWVPGNGKSRTIARSDATGNIAALASGTIYMAGGEGSVLRRGDRVTTVSLVSATTAGSGLTHSWAGIADQNRKVLAVSADDTTATLAANTGKDFTLGTPYVADADQAVYHFVCFVHSGGAVPTVQGVTLNSSAVSALAPVLCGTSNTSQTTPPAVGTTLTAITATALLALLYAS